MWKAARFEWVLEPGETSRARLCCKNTLNVCSNEWAYTVVLTVSVPDGDAVWTLAYHEKERSHHIPVGVWNKTIHSATEVCSPADLVSWLAIKVIDYSTKGKHSGPLWTRLFIWWVMNHTVAAILQTMKIMHLETDPEGTCRFPP